MRRRSPRGALAVLLVGAALAGLAGCRGESAPSGPRLVPQFGPIQPRRLSFSPRGPLRLAVVEADGTVSVWRLDAPRRPQCFAWLATSAADAVFAADGAALVVAGRDGALSWWHADGTPLRQVVDAHPGGVRTLAAGADLLVSGGADGSVRLWTIDGAPRGAPLDGHRGAVLSVAVSPRGEIASFGIDQQLRLWAPGADGGYRLVAVRDLTAPRFASMLPNLLQYDVNWGWGRALAFTADGMRLALAAFDGTVRLFGPDGTPIAAPAKAHGGQQVQTLAAAAGAPPLVSAGHDGGLQRWHPDGRPEGAHIAAHTAPAVGVAVSPDGALIASAGTDDRVRLWDRAGARVAELPARAADRLPGLAVSPDAGLVAALDERGQLRIWTRTAQARGVPIQAADRGRSALAFAPRGDRVAAACSVAGVCVWDVDGRALAGPLAGLRSEATALAFAPDGAILAAGTRYSALQLWPVPGGAPDWLPDGARGLVTGIAFSPDGTLLAAASEVLRIWTRDRTRRSDAVELHGGQALAIAVSPDSQLLATGGVDAQVRLWNRDAAAQGAPLVGHSGPVAALTFAGPGTLLSGGADGSVRVWDLATRQAQRLAVGPPVSAVGRAGALTWAATRRGEVQFFAAAGAHVASLLVEPDGAVVLAPDGTWAGSGALSGMLLAYDLDGLSVPVPAAGEERIAALLDGSQAAAGSP